jgi:hypothetical protein
MVVTFDQLRVYTPTCQASDPLRLSITSTLRPNGRASVGCTSASFRPPVHRPGQNRVARTLPNPFPLEHREDRELNPPPVPRREQLIGTRRCPRRVDEAGALIADRHGTAHGGIRSDNSAYTRIIGVYTLVSSAGESGSTRVLLAPASRGNSAASRRSFSFATAQGPPLLRPNSHTYEKRSPARRSRTPERFRASAARRHQARRAGRSSGLCIATDSEALVRHQREVRPLRARSNEAGA